MSDKEKLAAIVDLLTDKNVGKLVKEKALLNKDEEFGALVFATNAFNKAYKILKSV